MCSMNGSSKRLGLSPLLFLDLLCLTLRLAYPLMRAIKLS
jgi:hypothetical protein